MGSLNLRLFASKQATDEKASRDYTVTGSRILELAKQAHSHLFVQQSSEDQARLLKTLAFERTFDRGSLLATYRSRSTCSSKATKTGIGWVLGTEFATGWSRLHEPLRVATRAWPHYLTDEPREHVRYLYTNFGQPIDLHHPSGRYLHATSLGPVPSSIRMVAGWAASWTMTAKTWRRADPVTTARIGVSPGRASVSPFCSFAARVGVS